MGATESLETISGHWKALPGQWELKHRTSTLGSVTCYQWCHLAKHIRSSTVQANERCFWFYPVGIPALVSQVCTCKTGIENFIFPFMAVTDCDSGSMRWYSAYFRGEFFMELAWLEYNLPSRWERHLDGGRDAYSAPATNGLQIGEANHLSRPQMLLQ